MTATHTDQPRPLRLVASSGQSVSPSRHRAATNLGRAARHLQRCTLQHALANGHPVTADAVRVLLAVKQTTQAGEIKRFTCTGIWQLLFVDVVTWCRNRRLPVPADTAKALIAIIAYLDASDGFAEGSDTAAALFDAVDECTGGLTEPAPREPTFPAPRSRRDPMPSRRRSPSRRDSLRSSSGNFQT